MKKKEKEKEKGKKTEREEFSKMMWGKGSWEILEYIDQKGSAQYKDLKPFASTHTLNKRLKQLLSHGLIKHNITKTGKRKEWYELTEKGKSVFRSLRELQDCVEKKGSCQVVNDEVISDNM